MKSMIIKWLVFFVVSFLLIGWIFARELAERSHDWWEWALTDPVAQRELPFDRTYTIVGYKLTDTRGDAQKIKIQELRIEDKSSTQAVISLLLLNQGQSKSFPSLRVLLTNKAGVVIRRIEFSASDYSHGFEFITQRVQLVFDLREGESGFTVEPFYP